MVIDMDYLHSRRSIFIADIECFALCKINEQSVAEAAVGLGGLQPPLDPKTPWSPPLAPPSFWRRKDEEEGEE